MKICGLNPGPFTDCANTSTELPSHPVISPTTFHLNPTRLQNVTHNGRTLTPAFPSKIWIKHLREPPFCGYVYLLSTSNVCILLIISKPESHVYIRWKYIGLTTLIVLYNSFLYRIYTCNTHSYHMTILHNNNSFYWTVKSLWFFWD